MNTGGRLSGGAIDHNDGPGPRHVGLLHGLGASAETWHPLIALLLATATRPTHAIYVDRGLHRALPISGVQGRLFWLVPGLTLRVAGALQTWRSRSVRAAYDPAVKESMARARGLHHDLHLEDPGKVLGLMRDDL